MALFERSSNGMNLPGSPGAIKTEPLTLESLPALGAAMTPAKTPKGPSAGRARYNHNNQENNATSAKKQRLDFPNVGLTLHRTKNNSMQRRNARERNRVRYLNMTFEVLRQHLPFADNTKSKNKKISKVDTLRGAIDYIREMTSMLEDADAVDAALKGCDPSTPFIESDLMSSNGSLSPQGSPNTVSHSEEGGMTSEDDDLLDVNNWFSC